MPPVGRHAAFVLGAPGTYVDEREGALVIGHRPGAFAWTVAVAWPALVLGTMWLMRDAPLFVHAFLLLLALPATLAVLNRQRWEIRPGVLRMAGRAAGFRTERDWTLAADARARVETVPQTAPPRYQVQLLTSEGWIAVAQSALPEPTRAFAERAAAAARVPLAG